MHSFIIFEQNVEEVLGVLLNILLENYEGVHEEWGGTKFCGITLKWD